MSLSTALILGFLFHLVGDYLLQNNWMAQNKTKEFLPAFIHAYVYQMPFWFLFWGSNLIWIVFLTHFFIDRYRLATYWIKLVNWDWKSKNFGFSESTPIWLSTCLMIIIDNTFHIAINSFCIYLKYTP